MGKPGNQVPVSKNFKKNVEYLTKELRVEENFDVIHHKLVHGGRRMAMFFIDGFANDLSMIETLKSLNDLEIEDLKKNPIDTLTQSIIPHQEVETTEDLEEVIGQVLAGQTALIIENCNTAVMVDTREYPIRSPEEPDLERVVRGPRDGFVETIVFNAALMRRHVRDRSLVMEYLQIGKRSKKDIALAYIDSIADKELVDRIKKELEYIDVDGLPMGEKTLEEYIFGKRLSPYPLVRYTERGDTSSIHLMEGHVLILVDGSPSVMICPTTFWHHLQHAEEYRQAPAVGMFLRWIRFISVLIALFILPMWYLLATNPHLGGEHLAFLGPDDPGTIPLYVQFLLAEIGVDILRMAAIHTPNALATALGLVAAILIGEIAVEVGLFTNEVILYIAAAVIGNYATPSYELSLANRIFRLVFLTFAAAFGVVGFIIAVTIWLLALIKTKTLNVPYMWPLLPFNPRAFFLTLVRSPLPFNDKRPSILNTKDNTRQPPKRRIL
ncbi:spore germination protein [Alkalibacillus haloalkaliphilus]|uniref:spore germination protein n=1 Tax=Alkalibacillus haloalkaliphilus TaxID=94136 RepID=UPI00031589ED|nr:spore germination protein [Alkalibacillus haloalkaliphilus]